MKSEGAKLRAMRELEHKKRDRARVRELAAQIRELRRGRRARALELRAACREARLNVRTQVAELRAETERKVAALRDAQRGTCAASQLRAHVELGDAVGKLERERVEQLERNRRLYGRKAAAAGEAAKRAAERRSESDDEVRANIPRELVPAFERVKRSIKPSDRRTRTEAFLQWVHDNEEEAHAIAFEQVDREVERLVREQAELERATRGARRRITRASASADVPF